MQTRSSPFYAGIGGNGSKAYLCSACNSVITYSDRLVAVSGSKRHSFTNPAGVFCEFFTFSSCPGAVTFGDPTEEHSWFPGYSWSLALCKAAATIWGGPIKRLLNQRFSSSGGFSFTKYFPTKGKSQNLLTRAFVKF